MIRLSNGLDDIGGEEGMGDVVDRVLDSPAKNEAHTIDVVTQARNQLGKVQEVIPLRRLLVTGDADCIAI